MAHITTEIEDGLAVIAMDDGKANVLNFDMLEGLGEALDRAESEARAVILIGREGMLSGGFDLRVIQAGPDEAVRLVRSGAELLLRIFTSPVPIVAACPGHAVAAGALILLAADLRVGTTGPFKIGLNEVAIGMPLPVFAVELARQRLATRWHSRAVVHAELLDPSSAREAGFVDHLCEPDELEERARREAERLGRLSAMAFRRTRKSLRGASADMIRAGLDDDIVSVVQAMNPVES